MEDTERIRYRRQVDRVGIAQVCHLVTLDSELSDGTVRLYMLLLKYARDKDSCWPGVARLARDLNRGERTVKRHLAELTDRGLISREQRGLGRTAITWIEDLEEVYNPAVSKMALLAVDNSSSAKNGTAGSAKSDTALAVPKMAHKEETEEETDVKGGGGLTKEQELALDRLTDFGVNRPVALRLARRCPLAQVEGWLDYAAHAKGLRDPVAFVVKMLRDGEPAPERRRVGALDDRLRYISGEYANLIQH